MRARTFEPNLIGKTPEAGATAELRSAPHNIEAEQALLGAILVNNAALERVCGFLLAEHFFDQLHGAIFDTLSKLIPSGQRATPITLRTFFETAEPINPGLTVPQYLGRLAVNAAKIILDAADYGRAVDYGRTICDLAMRRQLIKFAEDLSTAAYDAPVDFSPAQMIVQAEAQLASFAIEQSDAQSGTFCTLDDAEDEHDQNDVIDGVMALGDVGVLVGISQAAKGFLIKDAGRQVALGRPFFGRTVRAGAVLNVEYEGGKKGLRNRGKAAGADLTTEEMAIYKRRHAWVLAA